MALTPALANLPRPAAQLGYILHLGINISGLWIWVQTCKGKIEGKKERKMKKEKKKRGGGKWRRRKREERRRTVKKTRK